MVHTMNGGYEGSFNRSSQRGERRSSQGRADQRRQTEVNKDYDPNSQSSGNATFAEIVQATTTPNKPDQNEQYKRHEGGQVAQLIDQMDTRTDDFVELRIGDRLGLSQIVLKRRRERGPHTVK